MNYKAIIRSAKLAMKNSHSPYSKFKVGAALLTQDGRIFSGCNIENSSFSLTICAERTAIFKAVSESHKKFKAIAIATDTVDFTPPCGACRQVMIDFSENLDIIMVNKKSLTKTVKIKDLLPLAFNNKQLSHK